LEQTDWHVGSLDHTMVQYAEILKKLGSRLMAKKQQSGEVNRSAAIRDLFKEKPDMTASEAIAALAAKGITISDHLFYKVKGKIAGRKKRRRKAHRKAIEMVVATGTTDVPIVKSDALATIRKVKAIAADVGGLRTLKGLVDALSE
jgi:NCAIR mutase (PurE)-related protein